MKTKCKILFVTSLAPLLITAVALIFMDNTVPVHFGLNGTPDRYGSKFEYLILPIITLAFYVFWKLFIKFYTKSSTDEVAKVNGVSLGYLLDELDEHISNIFNLAMNHVSE